MSELADESSYDPFAAETFVHPDVAAQTGLMAGKDVDTLKAIGGGIGDILTLPERAVQNSQFAVDTGVYDPRVPVEAALMTMGGGVGGTGAKAGEPVLGAGFVGRKLPTDNYTGPVSRYTDELFREMSPRAALEDLPTSVATGSPGLGGSRKFYADQPELALGQGQNRGVRVTYDAAPFEGQINKKPGWEAYFPEGRAEYTAAPTTNIRETVKGFEIDPSTLSKVEAAQYQRVLSNLEDRGWGVNRTPDKITVTRPADVTLGSGPTDKRGAVVAGLFNYSRLHEVPSVPQFDLPRYTPPRGVPQRILDVTNDPGVRDKMLEVIAQGKDMGGANWYNADPLREAFNKELGSKGDAAFRKYMDMVAATSPRSEVGANARNASYYYSRAMSGEGMPAVGDKNPQPYGHLAQRLHQMNAERVAGPGWDPLNNPKPASFVENLTGNQQPVTVDTHAFRLPGIIAQDPRFLETAFQVAKDAPKQNIPKMIESGETTMADAANRPAWWQAQPKANEYAAMEKYYQSLGKDLGLTPAQTQASAWVGGGKLTGLASDESKPFLRFLEDRVNLTAEKRGKTPEQTLKDFIRGKAPLLGLGGATLGGLAAQDRYEP